MKGGRNERKGAVAISGKRELTLEDLVDEVPHIVDAKATVPLISTLAASGCYWKNDRYNSPGHSFVVSNGTPFKIASEGPQSHRFVTGICRDGYYVVEDREYAGRKFESASQAVNAVREPSSNAFLYIQFCIAGAWVSADDLRRSDSSFLDSAEERDLEYTLAKVRKHPQHKMSNYVEAIKVAAKWLVAPKGKK
jgi:hypothetical protein